MRVLVTGVTGQVGGALARRLAAETGVTVIAADRGTLDLARPETIDAVLDRLSPDVVVNPAAYTAVDRAEDERELAFCVNARAVRTLAAWCARRPSPLLHLSTDYVFGGAGTRAWREDDAPAARNVYGESKRAGEQAVAEAGGPHLVVRTSWVYAAQGTNFLRSIARLATEREELRIVADQTGAPTPADFVAEVLAAILKRGRAELAQAFADAGGLLHVAAGGETTWHGFAEAIVAGLAARGVRVKCRRVVPITSADYPTRAERPRNSRLDLTRLRQRFGITPPPWRQLLERELDRLVPLLAAEAPG